MSSNTSHPKGLPVHLCLDVLVLEPPLNLDHRRIQVFKFPVPEVEKEIKNLGKHDAAAERVGRLFNEEIEKSQDRMRRAFQEMRQL